MALVYVGGTSGVGTSTGYTVSLNGTLTGGIASSPAAGDIVIVFSGFGNTAASAPAISGNNTGAYSFIPGTTSYHQNDTWDTEFAGFYAVMGGTPDTSLTVTRVTNAAYGGATVVQVWRGQNTTDPFDVAATVAGAGNTGLINPPAITPVTAGTRILAGGAGTQTTTGSAFTVSSNMTGPSISVKGDGTTSDIGVCIASHAWTSGSFTPNAVTGGSVSTSSSWRAMTLALREQPPAAYVLDAQPGTFTLTGQDATLLKTSAVNAEAGAFTLTGQDATLTFTPGIQNYEIDAQPGAFTLTGQAAALLKDSGFNAEAGTFSISGRDATLLKTSDLDAQPGAFTIGGQDATLTVTTSNYQFNAEAGAFTLTGQDATLTKDVVLVAEAGAFTLTGQPADLLLGSPNKVIVADAGAFTVAGQDATFLRDIVLSADAGAYNITGRDATLSIASFVLMTPAQKRNLFEIYLLHGLDSPLTVNATTRSAGSVSQTVASVSGTVSIFTDTHSTETVPDVGTMIDELAALHGLTETLTVTATTRSAGPVSQSFSTVGGETTVTRL